MKDGKYTIDDESDTILSNESIVSYAIQGVGTKFIDMLISKYKITRSEIANYLGISEKSIQNYQKQGKMLDPQQGEKLLKIQRLIEKGIEVFGNRENFKRWLSKPAYGLDQKIPETLLITSEGINLVYDEVERIAYGDLA